MKFFRCKYFQSEKGVALLWALVTITLLLAITGSMAGLIIKESQMSTSIDGSIRAYAAAESGIEHGEYLINTTSCASLTNPLEKTIEPNLTYTIAFSDINCSSPYTITLTTVGKSGSIKRSIEKVIRPVSRSEVLYTTDPGLVGGPPAYTHDFADFDPDLVLNEGTETKSYVQTFDLNLDTAMADIPASPQYLGVGLVSSTSNTGIIAKFYRDKVALKLNESITTTESGSDSTLLANNLRREDNFKVIIEYKKGLAAKVTVRRILSGSTITDDCSAILSRKVASSFGVFDRVYFYNTAGAITWTFAGLSFLDSTDEITGNEISRIPFLTVESD